VSGVNGPLCGVRKNQDRNYNIKFLKKLTRYLDFRTGLAMTLNIKDRQGVIQGMLMMMMMMMMMTFRDVAQSTVNNTYKTEAQDNFRRNMVIPQGWRMELINVNRLRYLTYFYDNH